MLIHTYEEITGSGWTVVAFPQPTRVDAVVEMKKWCQQMYGSHTAWIDSIEYGEVRFADEKDVALFMLKWS